MAQYKVVDENGGIYAIGHDRQKMQDRINSGYFHNKYLIDELKGVNLTI